MYVPDVYDQWEQREKKQQSELDELPKCYYCDEPIQEEYCYEINDELICVDCLNENFIRILP